MEGTGFVFFFFAPQAAEGLGPLPGQTRDVLKFVQLFVKSVIKGLEIQFNTYTYIHRGKRILSVWKGYDSKVK